MPNFQNEAPPESDHQGFRIVRTPTARPLIGHVLSSNLEGCPTHYVSARTIPCEAPNCDPCNNGIGWRWHGYLLVLLSSTQETVIFEMTAKASKAFSQYYKRYGTTRGCFFKAQRINDRPNGRVLIVAKPSDLSKVNLPPELDVKKLLCHVWNIAPNQAITPEYKTRPPFNTIQVDRDLPEMPQTIDVLHFCHDHARDWIMDHITDHTPNMRLFP